MEYPVITHFDPSVGTSSENILIYTDASHYDVQNNGYELAGNDFVTPGPHFTDDYVDAEFRETRTIFVDGGDRFGVCAVAFDQQEELLWMGNQGGHVTSYYGPGLQKYTSFQVHMTQEIRHISSFDDGILALTQNTLRCQMRRGIPIFTHSSDNMEDMQCLLQISPDTILMGGHQENIIEFNLTECQETSLSSVGASGCAILRQHGRFICAGDPSGRIELRAPNTLKVEHTLDAHSGSLSDFDVHGNTLVTCGFSLRQGVLSVDRFLMAYDLRMMRAISPIQLVVDPLLLRFLPSFSSRLAVVSTLGQMQLVDTLAVAQQPELYPIDTGGSLCLAFDVSSSCQCIALGDAGGTLHLYTSNTHTNMFNSFSQETEFADPVEPLPPTSIDDTNFPYSSIPLPYPPDGASLLSDWPEDLVQRTFRATPSIDPEILRTMKMKGTVGYATTPISCRRNQVRDRTVNLIGGKSVAETKYNSIIDDSSFIPIPKRYRKLIVNFSKYGGDDFDFDFYNRTRFSGLEATLPNSYCNAMLQVLYFISPIRKLIMSHMCAKEFCLACELSFLFYMLDVSQGSMCQASNFFRTFRSLPATAALGLVISEQNPRTKNTDLVSLIQRWHRFVLYQIHKDLLAEADQGNELQQTQFQETCSSSVFLGTAPFSAYHSFMQYNALQSFQPYPFRDVPQTSGAFRVQNHGFSSPKLPERRASQKGLNERKQRSRYWTEEEGHYLWITCEDLNFEGICNTEEQSVLSQLIGVRQLFRITCHKCSKKSSTDSTYLVCQLMYPEVGDDVEYPFCDVLHGSLISEKCVRSWCERCDKYQLTTHERRVKDLPSVLAVNTGFDKAEDTTRKDKAFWQKQMDFLVQKLVKSTQNCNVKPCRYGDHCNRPACKFRHVGRKEVEPPVIGGTKHIYYANPWVPMHMEINLTATGNVKIRSTSEMKEGPIPEEDGGDKIVKTVVYDLAAVVCFIEDESFEKRNLIAHINVSSEYHERATGAPIAQWYIFNDFSVSSVPPQEAVWYNLDWKIPCILYWTSTSLPSDIGPPVTNPISVDNLLYDSSIIMPEIETKSYTPLTLDEIPNKGDLVAIDAEFVTLNQEEAELRSDGKMNTIKPSLLSVARVTCIRGHGPMEGVAFIDDYISTNEQIVDYLTKFSGIKPGDLDANFSNKHLTTLKTTYLKLRYLIDRGVVFVGHGLKNDFRVINITVPPEQMVDTVVLFHLPRHRMVSLRFLAWHFLGLRIQAGNHDSIEDARAALLLYKHYLQLDEEGKVKLALRELYEVGKAHNWKVPGADSESDQELC